MRVRAWEWMIPIGAALAVWLGVGMMRSGQTAVRGEIGIALAAGVLAYMVYNWRDGDNGFAGSGLVVVGVVVVAWILAITVGGVDSDLFVNMIGVTP